MERQDGFRSATQTLFVTTVMLFPHASSGHEIAPPVPTPIFEPAFAVELQPQCAKRILLTADGLSGERAGLLTRPPFQPLLEVANSLNIESQSIVAENLADPERDELIAKFRASIEQAIEQNKEIHLVGYSMGSRVIVEVLASLADPSKDTYSPKLLGAIESVFLLSGRNNDPANGQNHPELPNYRKHYEPISPEVMQTIRTALSGKIHVFAEPDDDIVQTNQTKKQAEELGAEFVLVDGPGTHFASKEAGTVVAKYLKDMVQGNQISLLVAKPSRC